MAENHRFQQKTTEMKRETTKQIEINESIRKRIHNTRKMTTGLHFFTMNDFKRYKQEYEFLVGLTGWEFDHSISAQELSQFDENPIISVIYRGGLRVTLIFKEGSWSLGHTEAKLILTPDEETLLHSRETSTLEMLPILSSSDLLTRLAESIPARLAYDPSSGMEMSQCMRWIASRWDAWLVLSQQVTKLQAMYWTDVFLESNSQLIQGLQFDKWEHCSNLHAIVHLFFPERYRVDLHLYLDPWTAQTIICQTNVPESSKGVRRPFEGIKSSAVLSTHVEVKAQVFKGTCSADHIGLVLADSSLERGDWTGMCAQIDRMLREQNP
jgi:hypothetical protein